MPHWALCLVVPENMLAGRNVQSLPLCFMLVLSLHLILMQTGNDCTAENKTTEHYSFIEH